MTEAIVIEHGIPVPPPIRHCTSGPTVYAPKLSALITAPVGASVFFPGAKTQYVCDAGRNLGVGRDRLTYRTVEGGVRVWRIA